MRKQKKLQILSIQVCYTNLKVGEFSLNDYYLFGEPLWDFTLKKTAIERTNGFVVVLENISKVLIKLD